jgi:hypothetical protein
VDAGIQDDRRFQSISEALLEEAESYGHSPRCRRAGIFITSRGRGGHNILEARAVQEATDAGLSRAIYLSLR